MECKKHYDGESAESKKSEMVDRENIKTQCVRILCMSESQARSKPNYEATYFDRTLEVKTSNNNKIDLIHLISTLDKWLGASASGNKESETRFVLLFDEAHHLFKLDNAMAFRSVRWWLRRVHRSKIVAVFCGTTSSLLNFYPSDVVDPSGASRDPTIQYKNYESKGTTTDRDVQAEKERKLYPPFCQLHTIGCLRLVCAEKLRKPGTELEAAAAYGRPLFAYLASKNELLSYSTDGEPNKNRLEAILLRILCSETVFEDKQESLYSVLGTRVQMGVLTSFDLASTLVGKGYACLVAYNDDDKHGNRIELSFMVYPVCAGLSMGMMHDKWTVVDHDNPPMGKSPSFWIKKASEVFQSGLCLPDKGDTREVFAALYLLFCGDSIRHQLDSTFRTFQVPFQQWLSNVYINSNSSGPDPVPEERDMDAMESLQISQDKETKIDSMQTLATTNKVGSMSPPTKRRNTITEDVDMREKIENADSRSRSDPQIEVQEMKISFIQVCRNYFRCQGVYSDETFLKYMFEAGIACYSYPKCPAIDIASTICVTYANKQKSWYPLWVSVKNQRTFTPSDVLSAITRMKDLATRLRQSSPKNQRLAIFGIVLLLGCESPPKMKDGLEIPALKKFPAEDEYKFVAVKKNDKFGVYGALKSLDMDREKSEIYVSHGFVAGMNSFEGLLRSDSSEKENVEKLLTTLSLKKTNENLGV